MPERDQKRPRTVGQYFLSSVYSARFTHEERSASDVQRLEVKSVASKIAAAAELAFIAAAEWEAA